MEGWKKRSSIQPTPAKEEKTKLPRTWKSWMQRITQQLERERSIAPFILNARGPDIEREKYVSKVWHLRIYETSTFHFDGGLLQSS